MIPLSRQNPRQLAKLLNTAVKYVERKDIGKNFQRLPVPNAPWADNYLKVIDQVIDLDRIKVGERCLLHCRGKSRCLDIPTTTSFKTSNCCTRTPPSSMEKTTSWRGLLASLWVMSSLLCAIIWRYVLWLVATVAIYESGRAVEAQTLCRVDWRSKLVVSLFLNTLSSVSVSYYWISV